MNEKKPFPFLQKIYEIRKIKKISLTELAPAFGVGTNQGASLIENGSVSLRAEQIYDVAMVLGVPAWQLFIDDSAAKHKTDLGPLDEDEGTLISEFRKIPTNAKKKALLQIIQTILY